MSRKTDWMPHTRTGMLAKALLWSNVMPEEATIEGVTKKKYEWWGIPLEEVSAFMEDYATAREALEAAMNEEKDSTVATKICQDAFTRLEAVMRRLKRVYFHIPPLTEVDLVSLEIPLPDKTRSRTGTPACQVRIVVYYTGGLYEIGAKLESFNGDLDDPANKEFRIYYLVVAPGDPEPKSVKELVESFGTKRKSRNTIELTPEDSGKRIFMACRAENGKKKGPWGPMTSAVIP